jgi:hypothetical protein
VNEGRAKAPLPAEVRDLLRDSYRDEIRRFGRLIDRDLASWLA